ncbi:ATP-binding cassette sub-family G member 3-like [Sigmodon hispidus]
MSSNNDPVAIPMLERNPNDLPGMDSSDLNTVTGEAVLSFHNISYRETVQIGFPFRKKTRVIERLSNINGIMKPGLNAIMGPQDGSRSLLLDVLAARKDSRGLSGDILINGKPRPANFKCTSSYVPQDDILMHTVTVRDNIEFSAALRLPMTISRDERRRRVDEVLELLHLNEESNVKPRSKQCRKRTSIAMELVAEHPILFLDDPTTGLDLNTTTDVISVLRRMSMRGRTIIFSINQPQYFIFRFFDSLTLLSSGKVMFHGPAQEALQYFSSAGYNYDSHNNPADFFLDIIHGGFSAILDTEEDGHDADKYKELSERQHQVTEELANMYVQSAIYTHLRTELDLLLGEQEAGRSSALEEVTCVTPVWHQLGWIICHSFKNFKGFPLVTLIQAIITVLLAMIGGIAFHFLQNDCTAVQTRVVLLYLLTVFQCITSVSAGELFVIDRVRFLHQHSSGYYRISSYFWGKFLAELVPRRLLPSIIFTLIVFSIAAVQTPVKTDVKGFFIMLFTIMVLAYSASSLALSLGAGEKAVSVPTLFVTTYLVFMLFFSGLSVYSGSLVPGLSRIQYINIPHYGFTPKALLHNEFLGQNFCPEHKTAEISRCQNYVMKEEPPEMSSNNDPVAIPMLESNPNVLPGMDSSDLNTLTGEAVLSFHNISYRETVQRGFPFHKKTRVIERLSNINGIMKPGLNAIMGPQDGSRSLLLDVLAARKDPRGLSGDILINGKPRPANFKCTSGYVPQNDVVMHTVTVRENIEFAAALRLPMTITRDEKRRRVHEVLELLHLDHEANVQDQQNPCSLKTYQLPRSKELEKRTSIAMELVTEHPVLFLDDPTTGLDLRTTTDVISVLRRMSMRGRTIIFSINQPQYSIFRFFDSLTLLSSGKVMFHGPAQKALEYFTSAGYEYDSHNNPADFILDIINGGFSTILDTEEDSHKGDKYKELSEKQYQVTEKLANMYAQSPVYRDIRTELDLLLAEQEGGMSSALEEITCVTPFWHQLGWIVCRSFKNSMGFPLVTMIQMIAFVTLALLSSVSSLFDLLPHVCLGFTFLWSIDFKHTNQMETRANLLFLLTAFQCLTSVTAGEIFVLERDRFLHEHNSGYYRVSSYFLGKMLAELVPRRLLPSIIFTVIVFSTAAMKPCGLCLFFLEGMLADVKGFFTMLFTVMMLAYSTSSLPLSIGAGENVAALPTVIVTIYFVFMLIFSGLSLYAESLIAELSWIQFINVPHYGFIPKALQHNEFLGQNFCPEHKTAEISRCPKYVICTGEEFLMIQGIDISSWGFWKNHVALACTMVIFLSITYVKLLSTRKRDF